MHLAPNGTFEGATGREYRQVTILTGVTTIEAQHINALGVEAWVAVPDGVLTGPTTVTMHCPPGQLFRITGGTAWIS